MITCHKREGEDRMTLIRRIVPTSFWSDVPVIEDYTTQDKLFMLYLLTCPSSSQLGIYSLPKRMISFHTGYSSEEVEALLERMEELHACIAYCHETQEVAIKDYLSYAIIKGGRPVTDLLTRELTRVKDISLIEATYQAMQDYWQRSRRPIDQTICQLFEQELIRRGSQLMPSTAPDTPSQCESTEGTAPCPTINDKVTVLEDAAPDNTPEDAPIWKDWTIPIVSLDGSSPTEHKADLVQRHQEVIDHYETQLHTLAHKDRYQLALLSEEHGPSTVIKALDESRQAKFPLSYTRGVLNNWIHRGII